MEPLNSPLARLLDFLVVRIVYFFVCFIGMAFASLRWNISREDWWLVVGGASFVVALFGPWIYEPAHARRWGRVRDTREDRQR